LYPGGLNGIKSLLAGASLQLGSRPAVTGADLLSRGYNQFLERIGSEDVRNQVKLCKPFIINFGRFVDSSTQYVLSFASTFFIS
jgi:hypothetical protein